MVNTANSRISYKGAMRAIPSWRQSMFLFQFFFLSAHQEEAAQQGNDIQHDGDI